MDKWSVVSVFVLFLCSATLQVSAYRSYNTSGARRDDMLNVHIVPHTHDDSGWLKTLDQYYFGSNQTIQLAGVQYILDTVVASLAANPDRKFSFAEMSFFSMWWAEQSEHTQKLVHQLVKNKQLGFVNGGYVQNDEAASHYVAMIDQMTVGHQFLDRTFGYNPRIGWQVDPFGHSSTQASLMTGALGFDALYFGRADYQDMAIRGTKKQYELLWRGAKSYGCSADVLTGNFASGNHGPPSGFQWEWGTPEGNAEPFMDDPNLEEHNVDSRIEEFVEAGRKLSNVTYGNANMLTMGCADLSNYGPPPGFQWEWGTPEGNAEPFMDDPNLEEHNVDRRIEEFVEACRKLSNVTYGNDIMLTMGTDFTYSNAFVWYKNMDKLIHYANKDGRLNVFYSSPDAYTDAKNKYNTSWPLKTDDFFPYADCATCYWTGYFTSRPTSKGWIRSSTSFLQAARQLEILTPAGRDAAVHPGAGSISGKALSTGTLELAVSLLQHHDAITGTEKQHVANDYHRRLARALSDAGSAFRETTASLVYQDSSETAGDNKAGSLGLCPLLNTSVCHPTVEMSNLGHSMVAVLYNPLAWPRTEGVRIPINTSYSSSWTVTDGDGTNVKSQLLPISNATEDLQKAMLAAEILPNMRSAASHELAFIATVPPLGYSTYTISVDDDTAQPELTSAQPSTLREFLAGRNMADNSTASEETLQLSSGPLDLNVSTNTGRLLSLTNQAGLLSARINSEVIWYNSSDAKGPPPSNTWNPPSGAYMFRPNGLFTSAAPVLMQVVGGPVLTEIRQTFYPWASLTTRLWKGAEHIEVEWTVGPIPFKDGLGREISVRYESNVTSKDTFYTDSNGREMIKRVRDYRPTWKLDVTEPISGNYYPLTAGMYIKNEDTGPELSIVMDRAQSRGSLKSRQAKIMDERTGAELAIVTDRAQGGGSLKSGQAEIMVHRRTLLDDWRGVGEPLNETMCGCSACDCDGLIARGTHYITLQGSDSAATYRRTLQQRVNDPLVLLFGRAAERSGRAVQGNPGQMSFMQDPKGLPPNVHLPTLKDNGDGKVLLRLAHLYQVDEVSSHARNAEVDLNKLFTGLTFDEGEELALSAGQPLSKVNRLRWRAGKKIANGVDGVDEAEPQTSYELRTGMRWQRHDSNGFVVELQPMEIRTFLLTAATAKAQHSQEHISAAAAAQLDTCLP